MTAVRIHRSVQRGGKMFMANHCLRVMFVAVLVVVLPPSTKAQPQPDSMSKETPAGAGANGELERDLILSDPLDSTNEPEDRLVILPEITREGEQFYLSSFKLQIGRASCRERV